MLVHEGLKVCRAKKKGHVSRHATSSGFSNCDAIVGDKHWPTRGTQGRPLVPQTKGGPF